ncbi:MAG: vanadium-dependent haloperoxidase [Bacteroidota bacterium]|nr:vanadium-dependent haloperoxidase [Bacteroidota bacterium]
MFIGCTSFNKKPKINDAEVIHQNLDQVTQVIIYDVFNPPVASRIYAYTSLAAYEAIRFKKSNAPSIAEQMNGFTKMPQPKPSKTYNYTLASSKAFFTVAHKMVFAVDSLKSYEDSLFSLFKESMDDSTYQRSVAFGEAVGNAILERADKDNYAITRSMPKYLGSHDPGKWRPTPPDYADGVEPYWAMIKTFALDSAAQFRPGPPPTFSTDTASAFFKDVKELYDINKHITKEQTTIAKFWDDNAFIVEHSGHLMYATKKITPGGHWMGITTIACRKSNADEVKSAEAYALTSIGLLDAFIACWDTKYIYNSIRPVTVINDVIEKNWDPILQTPAHPEYTCGHCTISSAAAVILTHEFGDNFAFHDNSDEAYTGLTRDFASFVKASEETGISRLYGGIHFHNSIRVGMTLGKSVGHALLNKLHLQ